MGVRHLRTVLVYGACAAFALSGTASAQTVGSCTDLGGGAKKCFGEDTDGASETTRVTSFTNSDGAQSLFINAMGTGWTYVTENFETTSGAGAYFKSYSTVGVSAFIGSSADTIKSQSASTTDGFGRYPRSNTKYVQTKANSFSVLFTSLVNSFGFYGIDVGDFGGQLDIRIENTGTATTVFTDQPAHYKDPLQDGNGGTALFYSYLNTAAAFDKISFTITGGKTQTTTDSEVVPVDDIISFDDMSFGTYVAPEPEQSVVPEPVSMLLLGTGLLGVGGAARRRRRREDEVD